MDLFTSSVINVNNNSGHILWGRWDLVHVRIAFLLVLPGVLVLCKLRVVQSGPTDTFTLKYDLQMAGCESWPIKTLGSLYSTQPSPVRHISWRLCEAAFMRTAYLDRKYRVFPTKKRPCCHPFKLQNWVIKLLDSAIRLMFCRAGEYNFSSSPLIHYVQMVAKCFNILQFFPRLVC